MQIEHLEHRVAVLDMELKAVRQDLRALRSEREWETAPPPPPPAGYVPAAPTPPVAPAAPPLPPAAPPSVTPNGMSLDDLLAGRVMAWTGGAAVLIGLILFLALAVSRGWIGEEARTTMAAFASLLLVAGGFRGYERAGRTEAAVAATAAGIAGGFATLAVATEVYALMPAFLGLLAGLALGGVAAWIALRWESPTIAVLGIAGALLSPVLVGADVAEPVIVGLLVAAYCGAVAVCVALGWSWLGLLAFGLVTPQWALHVAENDTLDVVVAFGVLGALAAAGFVLREREERFDVVSHLLLAVNAAVTAVAGYAVLWETAPELDERLWLAGVAAVHLAGGLVLLRTRAEARTLAIAALAIGVILADIAFAMLVSGLAEPLVWALSAVGFALLVRAEQVAVLGLGGHLALAIGHLLSEDAPAAALGGDGSAAGLVGMIGIAAACLVSARVVEPDLRRALQALGLLAVAYATGLAFDGAALAVAYAAQAATLGALARRGDRDAGIAAAVFLAGAAGVAVGLSAPPTALALGLEDAAAAVLALLAVAAAAPAVLYGREGWYAGGVTLLYLASLLVVSAFEGQPGQLSLSALWAATGLAALIAGIVRDEAPLRAFALGLLAVATGKVFIVDLASLDSMTRVGSFLVLGTLLLAGAFAWQRVRPQPRDS